MFGACQDLKFIGAEETECGRIPDLRPRLRAVAESQWCTRASVVVSNEIEHGVCRPRLLPVPHPEVLRVPNIHARRILIVMGLSSLLQDVIL